MLILNHTDPLDHLFTSGFRMQTCHKFRSILIGDLSQLLKVCLFSVLEVMINSDI